MNQELDNYLIHTRSRFEEQTNLPLETPLYHYTSMEALNILLAIRAAWESIET